MLFVDAIPTEVQRIMETGLLLPDRFDQFLGLTHGLNEQFEWMSYNTLHEPGEALEYAIFKFSAAWYYILQCSNEDLAIDPNTCAVAEQVCRSFERTLKGSGPGAGTKTCQRFFQL